MRGVTKLLLAGALVFVLATGLGACGGDDSGESTPRSTAAATEQNAPAGTPEDDGAAEKGPASEKKPGSGPGEDGGASPSPGGSGNGSPGDDPSSGGSPPAGSDSPKPAGSGSGKRQGSPGSASGGSGSQGFIRPGGDNSIPNFGAEASGAELAAASRAVTTFMQARARSDWDAVCSHLAASTTRPLEQLASRSKELTGKACPELLEALVGATPASTRKSTLGGPLDSFRVQGDRGFALYHGTDGQDYFLPMAKESGQWKAGALAPSAFPG